MHSLRSCLRALGLPVRANACGTSVSRRRLLRHELLGERHLLAADPIPVLAVDFDRGVVEDGSFQSQTFQSGRDYVVEDSDLDGSLRITRGGGFASFASSDTLYGNDAFTVTASFKKDQANESGRLIHFHRTAVLEVRANELVVQVGTELVDGAADGGGIWLRPRDVGVNDTDWHQIALTYSQSSGTATLYLDGRQVAAETGILGAQNDLRYWDFVLGNPWWHDHFEGLIDDVRFYPSALDAAAVASLHDEMVQRLSGPVARDDVFVVNEDGGDLDANGDGQVDVADYLAFRTAFGRTTSDIEYDPRFDTNDNGQIDVVDYLAFRLALTQNNFLVLENDTADADRTLTITSVSDGSHGGQATVMDGAWILYRPAPDFFGEETLTYTVSDGTPGGEASATVRVTVNPVSDIVPDLVTTSEDTPLTVDLLANDSFEGTALITAVTQGTHGSVAIEADGTVTYLPAPDFSGSDSFGYSVTSGGVTESAQVSVQVASQQDIEGDAAVTLMESPIDIDVLANDRFSAAATVTSVSQADGGTVTINADGTVNYAPRAGFLGRDRFTYTAAANGVTETAEVTVGVLRVSPDDAINFHDYVVGGFGGAQDAGGVATIEDGGWTLHLDGNAWKQIELPYQITENTVLEFDYRTTVSGELHLIGMSAGLEHDGEKLFQLAGNHTWTRQDYRETDSPDWNHFRIDLGQFYTGEHAYLAFVNDNDLNPSEAESYFSNLVLFEEATNAAPTAQNDRFSVDEDGTVSGNVMADNGSGVDVDAEGPIRVSEINRVPFEAGVPFGLPSGARLTMNADGSFVYDPNGRFDHLASGDQATDAFTYTIDDGSGKANSTATATVTITIAGIGEVVGVQTIAPSIQWDGTTSWPGRDSPRDPVRTTFKPIAHFAIPPHQDVTQDLTIPVVAFAKGGVDRVSFFVEGSTVDVLAPTIVTEYEGDPFEAFSITLDASEFPSIDGRFDVIATVYPADPLAQERVIHLPLYANIGNGLPTATVHIDADTGNDTSGNGTAASPYRTIAQARNVLRDQGNIDGGQIILHAGDYTISDGVSGNVSNQRWLTIRSAPGENARIVGSGTQFSGLRVRRIKYQDISFVHLGGNSQIVTDSQFADAALWVSSSSYVGPGRTNSRFGSSRLTLGFEQTYFTDVTSSSSRDGLIAAKMSRNVTVTDISSDALSLTDAVIGAHVDVVDASGTTNHPDLWQLTSGDHENKLLYGVTTTTNTQAQGVFLDDFTIPARDIAIVNNLVQTGTFLSQINDVQISHLLLIGNTFVGTLAIRDNSDAGLTLENMEVVGNIFGGVWSTVASAADGLNGNLWDSNFFVDSASARGTNAAAGSAEWSEHFVPTAEGNLQMSRARFSALDARGIERSLLNAYFGALEAV